jgi:hypothetical protein
MPEHLDRPQTKPRLKGSDAGAPGPAPNQTPTEGRSRTPRRRRDAADLVKTLANRGRPKKSSLSPRAAGGDDGRAWGGDGGSDAGGARTWTSRAEHLTRPQTKPRPKARAAHHAADLEDGPRKPGVAQRSPPSPPVRGRRGKREDPMPEHMDPAPNQPRPKARAAHHAANDAADAAADLTAQVRAAPTPRLGPPSENEPTPTAPERDRGRQTTRASAGSFTPSASSRAPSPSRRTGDTARGRASGTPP